MSTGAPKISTVVQGEGEPKAGWNLLQVLHPIQPMSLRGESRAPLDSQLLILGSWWRMEMTHNIHYCIGNLQILKSGVS